MRIIVLLVGALAFSAVPTWAAVIPAEIVVGDHILNAAPGQKIPIYIQAGQPDPQNPTVPFPGAAGMTFNVQVGDGGPEAGGSEDGPPITHVELVNDADFGPTIFGANNTGMFPDNPATRSIVPQIYAVNVSTTSGEVTADGLLAVITLDGTGFSPNDLCAVDLIISQTLNGRTRLDDNTPLVQPIPLVILDGTIMCPEPSTSLLAILAIAGLLAYTIRRKGGVR